MCIPSEWERTNAIVDTIRRMQVTSAKFTPSLVSNLVIEGVPTLDTLILGGESAPTSLVEKLASKFRLILVYGMLNFWSTIPSFKSSQFHFLALIR
jgi:hypothetical protein